MGEVIDLSAPGWRENTCYPGTHWLRYDNRRDYVARVDYKPWMNGRYMWRTLNWSRPEKEVYGYEETLEAAQKAADEVLSGQPHQMKLF